MANQLLAPPLRVRTPRLPARALAVLANYGLEATVVAICVGLLGAVMPSLFVSDSWLALVDGRFVVQHGLPHADTLAYWTRGRPWVDQQWGAQLLLYAAERAGGLAATAALGIACVGAALAGVAVAARRLGASSRSTAMALLVAPIAAPWLMQVRTQSLALPLYVSVVGLLVADARRPGRRVFLVLPLLVVWANLHGSVSLAAGLVALHGAVAASRGRRSALALLIAPLALVASPYGWSLAGYYRLMLLHPPFASVVTEWRPITVGAATAPFLVTAFAGTALWARHRRVLTGFEQWALPLLLIAALSAVRNAVWFELAFAVALPRLLDAAFPPAPPSAGAQRLHRLVGVTASVLAIAVVAGAIARGDSWFVRDGSPAAAAAVARAAGAHGVVLADDVHADWLLWEQPVLAGRIAYDVRFELLSRRQLATVVGLDHAEHVAWSRCGRAMSVVTFDSPAARRMFESAAVLNPGARLAVDDESFGAFVQTPQGRPCAH